MLMCDDRPAPPAHFEPWKLESNAEISILAAHMDLPEFAPKNLNRLVQVYRSH